MLTPLCSSRHDVRIRDLRDLAVFGSCEARGQTIASDAYNEGGRLSEGEILLLERFG